MAKYIIKVETGKTNTRINIPKELVRNKGWGNQKYVLLEDIGDDKLTIQKWVDDEALKRKDSRG